MCITSPKLGNRKLHTIAVIPLESKYRRVCKDTVVALTASWTPGHIPMVLKTVFNALLRTIPFENDLTGGQSVYIV